MGILIIVILFVAGMALGYIFRNKLKEAFVSKSTSAIIYVLLFVLGVSVGGNDVVMDSLDTIGLNAVIITAGAMLGSMAMAYLVYRIIYKSKKSE